MTIRSSAKCAKCRNDVWDIWPSKKIATCANCGSERPYHERKRRDEITPSQEKATEHIRRYFLNRARLEELERFEIELQEDTGLIYVKVDTHASVYRNDGGFFAIGRRGAIHVLSSHSLYTKEAHYAKMLGGKVGW